MQITFLGTGASEGIPGAFCECPRCQEARSTLGKEVRHRSSALINDDLLIDLGPDLFSMFPTTHVAPGKIHFALQTHPQTDHINGLTLLSRSTESAAQVSTCLDYYAGTSSMQELAWQLHKPAGFFDDDRHQAAYNLRFHIIRPWAELFFGNYEVLAVPAAYDRIPDTYLFAIRESSTGQTIFYGTDTAPLPDETWDEVAQRGWRFDLFILEQTMGSGAESLGHHNARQFQRSISQGRLAGVIDVTTRVVATHFVHHSCPSHRELEAQGAVNGFIPAWDGLTLPAIAEDP